MYYCFFISGDFVSTIASLMLYWRIRYHYFFPTLGGGFLYWLSNLFITNSIGDDI